MQATEPEIQKSGDLMSILKKQICLFESVRKRGHQLELAYQYLMSITPISVEPERAFSLAEYIGTKLRNTLRDTTLDALLFLRSFFQNEKK